MRKSKIIVISLLLIVMSVFVANATTNGQKEATNIKISLNGNLLSFNSSTGIPYLNQENRVMMPLREILEKSSHKVEWNSLDQSIKIDNKLHLKINSLNLKTDTDTITMDTAPVLRPDGKSYIPLRYVLENLEKNYKVDYEGPKASNGHFHTINIIGGSSTPTQPVDGAYVHNGYLDFDRDLKNDNSLKKALENEYGDNFQIERFYVEGGGKGPMAGVMAIHKTLSDGSKAWELTIRQYSKNVNGIKSILLNIAGETAGSNIYDWIVRNYDKEVDLNPNTWKKMSDKIEVYYDRASGSATFYIRNIQ